MLLLNEKVALQEIEIQRLRDALQDILHGPIGVCDEREYRHALEQIAHDALYGEDDTAHYGNWKFYNQ